MKTIWSVIFLLVLVDCRQDNKYEASRHRIFSASPTLRAVSIVSSPAMPEPLSIPLQQEGGSYVVRVGELPVGDYHFETVVYANGLEVCRGGADGKVSRGRTVDVVVNLPDCPAGGR